MTLPSLTPGNEPVAPNGPATGWRIYDTPEASAAFGDAQARLDELAIGEFGYTEDQAAADQMICDRYDRYVAQPAWDEFRDQCDADEFRSNYPEPPDGSRVEFEANRGTLYGAMRLDDPDKPSEAHWYLYGEDEAWTWRDLVYHYKIDMGELVMLVPATAAEPAVDAAPGPFPLKVDEWVQLTLDAIVADLSDPEETEGFWTFGVEIHGERHLLCLTTSEVAERVTRGASC